MMVFHVLNCIDHDAEYIHDKLVEYNVSQIPKTQETEFKDINKKIVDENGNIVAGCLATIYCWKILFIEILWVDTSFSKEG